jgi:capsule polysaccharide export protein KpsC/LpsZ
MDLRQAALRQADLTQIQNMTLYPPAALEALVLDGAPIAVCLAVFLSPALPQEHDRASLAKRISPRERVRSSLQPFSAAVVQYSRGIRPNPGQSQVFQGRIREGLGMN